MIEKATFVAKELLGKYLVRRECGRERVLMITEVEVYDGYKDRASHARNGITKRNALMYGEPGVFYVYVVYGIHEMLNIVTREKGYPAAVLIRGVLGVSGPGRVTKVLNVDRSLSGKKANKTSGLWIEDSGIHVSNKDIDYEERVGVAYAGDLWAKKKWRITLSLS